LATTQGEKRKRQKSPPVAERGITESNAMKIQILAFGITRDILGSNTIQLDLPQATKVAELRQQLYAQYPALQKLNNLAIALNTEYAGEDQVIGERDEVVLIPPVSGG
jgi:molybdopterin synthase sulfur carrier subunit